MQELLPSEFRFGNYGAGIPFQVYMDKQLMMALLTERAVGYCYDPEHRPQEGQVAVMFELEDFGRYWSHIPDYIFSKFLHQSNGAK